MTNGYSRKVQTLDPIGFLRISKMGMLDPSVLNLQSAVKIELYCY